MGLEITIDNLDDMCDLMCGNIIPKKGDKMTETVQKIKNTTSIFGWTITELAKRSGVSKSIISRAFNGINNPNIDTVEKMAGALGLEIRLYKE